MNIDQSIFKAYDIRGIVPDQVNPKVAEQVGRAFARWLLGRRKKKEERRKLKIIVGRDVRTHSPKIAEALISGITSQFIDVVDVGLITSPMLYFIIGSAGFDGGIIVTASHNSAEYNGFKLVREEAQAISGDSGIQEIGQMVSAKNIPDLPKKGQVLKEDYLDRYVEHVFKFTDLSKLKKFNILVNPNFGSTSLILDKLEKKLNLEFVKFNYELNGSFPKGKPDPLLLKNQEETATKIIETKVDLGVTWDADGDRIFFIDENGVFVDAYYTTALLADEILKYNSGAKILHDVRLTWAIEDKIKKRGGVDLVYKAGHAFFKEKMRAEGAIFAGETSGHYYFHQDNFYADDGIIPFLLIWQMLSKNNSKMSDLVDPLRQKYFKPKNEVNFEVLDTNSTLTRIEEKYSTGQISKIDGLSVDFPDWHFNIRGSNTEPVVRLNLEAKSKGVLDKEYPKLIDFIKSIGGKEKI